MTSWPRSASVLPIAKPTTPAPMTSVSKSVVVVMGAWLLRVRAQFKCGMRAFRSRKLMQYAVRPTCVRGHGGRPGYCAVEPLAVPLTIGFAGALDDEAAMAGVPAGTELPAFCATGSSARRDFPSK
jgi:hypothetical protein